MPPRTDPAKLMATYLATGEGAKFALARYADPNDPYAGVSYIAAEAVYHALGATKSGLRPMLLQLGEKELHVFLADKAGNIVDPTAKRFPKKLDYSLGAPCYMPTAISKRARLLADAAGLSLA